MITRQEIESFIPGQWTLTDAQMQEIKALALAGFDSLVAGPLANVRRMTDEIEAEDQGDDEECAFPNAEVRDWLEAEATPGKYP